MPDTHLTIDPSPTSEEIPAWLSEIMEEYKESKNNRKPNIPKVPEQNIHELQQVEKLKARMMVEFVKDPFNDSGAPRKDFYVNVKEELQKARGCYDESITEKFSDEEFIKMMLLKAASFSNSCTLPFAVLDSLRKQRLELQHVSLDWSPPPEKTQPDHLLQLLYYKSMYHYSKRNHKKAQPGSRGHGLYYSAKNLKKVGILFRPRWTAGAITDVKFKSSFLSGKVEAPPIIIDESTESLLLNLVAYESAAALDQLWVSSYILFMDSLIDDAQDVEEMRSNGIIINYLGADQKVANLFNEMGKSLTHDTYDTAAYNDVKMAINKQCESTVKRWAYEWKKTYFSNPWTFITVLAASFGLGLTATQTYYTRFPPK
ncbi:hypothetical protein DKX38_023672 [Salix brachista]|uniref:Uncharacterized protein n=1 Tax=Salix brachista TaxID=2182728 RepID=A0A5N5JPW5_9ROSI|nr:hypothetical protein DKX38_023672 [Salix brachista]